MSETAPPPMIELSEAELDGLIERLAQAMAHDLALSVDDLRILLQLVLSFARECKLICVNAHFRQDLKEPYHEES
jgi:hypothetical protein